MGEGVLQLAGRLQPRIRKIASERGWKLVSPPQLVEPGLTEKDILAALDILEKMGWLISHATVECDDGHSVWTGRFGEIGPHSTDECPICGNHGPHGMVSVFYELSASALSELQDQKKSLH
jgi:hypothetical protein